MLSGSIFISGAGGCLHTKRRRASFEAFACPQLGFWLAFGRLGSPFRAAEVARDGGNMHRYWNGNIGRVIQLSDQACAVTLDILGQHDNRTSYYKFRLKPSEHTSASTQQQSAGELPTTRSQCRMAFGANTKTWPENPRRHRSSRYLHIQCSIPHWLGRSSPIKRGPVDSRHHQNRGGGSVGGANGAGET